MERSPSPLIAQRERFWATLLWSLVVGCLGQLALVGCNAPPANSDGNDNGDTNGNVNGNDNSGGGDSLRSANCLGCHTNEAMLKLVARDEPPPAEDTGEG